MPNITVNTVRYIVASMIFLLSACSSTAEKPAADTSLADSRSAQQIYKQASATLRSGDYEAAITELEELETRFPFGPFAQQAQLDIAYAYYKYKEYESSTSAVERFIKLYPRHPRVDYAYYLKGMIRYSEVHSSFDKVTGQDPSQRDPGAARQAFQHFNTLVRNFPDSPYTSDALQRMIYLRNSLARHELRAAEFNMQRGAWIAAAARARYILEYFQRTPSAVDAVAVLVQAYEKLGLDALASDSRRVLQQNAPSHPMLEGKPLQTPLTGLATNG